MRASMSATGSVNLIVCFSSSRPFAWSVLRWAEEPATTSSYACVGSEKRAGLADMPPTPTARAHPYQDDFETPGISPRKARPRKQSRHTPNLRR